MQSDSWWSTLELSNQTAAQAAAIAECNKRQSKLPCYAD